MDYSEAQLAHPTRKAGSRWYFAGMAAVLLAIVAVGFAKSFYLRNVIHHAHSPVALPGYLVLHGILLSAWFLLFFVQSVLAATGRVPIHRSLGGAGAVLAVAIFALSMVVVVRSVARETSLVVFGDMIILVLFLILVVTAIWRRQNPEVHKRLMLIASICMVAPAMARWPGAQALLPLSVLVPQLLLLASLIAYDVMTRRRVHAATIWGVAMYFAGGGVNIALSSSKFGHALIEALK
jgi:hypothetical protein